MNAIILVAGRGSRLEAITIDSPKCFAIVNNKTILSNAIQILSACGFCECILVIGYKGNMIRETMGDKYENMKLRYVLNDKYDRTNTSYSLQLALRNLNITGDIFILEGDVFFEQKLIENLIQDDKANSTIIEPYDIIYDGSFVEIDEERRIMDWVHKSKRPEGYKLMDKYKTVNIHKFCKDFMVEILSPYLEKYLTKGEINLPLEYIMQEIIEQDKATVFGLLANGLKWYEIDTPEELEIANLIFKST